MARTLTKPDSNMTQSGVTDLRTRGDDVTKRIIDITVALMVLVGLSPIWLLIAAAIRLSSPGPALFTRTVVGRHGQPFTYYKFRSMRADADDSHHRAWLEEFVRADQPYVTVDGPDGSRPVYKVVDDSRVTPVGRWLRRMSVDEVPQFINVLRGEMSIVGPRPPVQPEYELYDDWARARLAVKPGITGLYQVTARSAVGFSDMVRIDLEYIQRRSILLDLSIMARTPFVMLLGKGAA